jgi:hypothetical protein
MFPLGTHYCGHEYFMHVVYVSEFITHCKSNINTTVNQMPCDGLPILVKNYTPQKGEGTKEWW